MHPLPSQAVDQAIHDGSRRIRQRRIERIVALQGIDELIDGGAHGQWRVAAPEAALRNADAAGVGVDLLVAGGEDPRAHAQAPGGLVDRTTETQRLDIRELSFAERVAADIVEFAL